MPAPPPPIIITSNATIKQFLERQPQRFQRTTCFWLSIAGLPGRPFQISERTLFLLFQMAPKLCELVVSSEQPVLGDAFVRTAERAANQGRNAPDHASSSTAVPPQPIGKRLKRITFRRVWLSSKSFRSFGSSVPRATHWAHSLESITFYKSNAFANQ